MTNTNNNTKGFYVNTYDADGTARTSEYHRTEASARAKADRIAKMYAKRHPDRVVEVSKTRAR